MAVDQQFIQNRANLIRYNFIEEMERHLLAFESVANSHNLNVQWITDEEALVEYIYNILTKQHYNKVCFDLKKIPEDIVQDKNKVIQIVKPENLLELGAEHLFIEADFGIIENGSVVLVNKKSTEAINQINNLVLLLNINNFIIKQSDLELILSLKQKDNDRFLFEDIKIITSPFDHVTSQTYGHLGDDENNEKVSITILLYDNGITDIMVNNVLREVLYCINCGKCSDVCPVYKYTNDFSPIELIRHNCFASNQLDRNIFKNTTLCGYCEKACPIGIPLTELLVTEMEMVSARTNRERNIDIMKLYSKRSKLNKVNGTFRRFFYLKKMYGKNKKIHSYYKSQKETFYSITKTSKE